LFCSDGDFYPPTFNCRAPGCTAPAVRHSLSTSCQEGAHLPSGGTCTPNCAVGSEASVPALTCSAGRLTPLTFSCSEPRCAAPTVQFAKTPSCREGATIKSGGVCTLLCQSGYVSSVELLSCLVGDFSPSNFTCSPHNALEQLVTTPAAVVVTVFFAFFAVLVLVLISCSRQRGVRPSPAHGDTPVPTGVTKGRRDTLVEQAIVIGGRLDTISEKSTFKEDESGDTVAAPWNSWAASTWGEDA